jgi:hypothetical protein
MTTPNINVSELSADQIKELESQLRLRRTSAKKAEKYAKFPMYQTYRDSVIAAKTANDTKKKLLAELKALGFGKKTPPAPSIKTTGKKKEITFLTPKNPTR